MSSMNQAVALTERQRVVVAEAVEFQIEARQSDPGEDFAVWNLRQVLAEMTRTSDLAGTKVIHLTAEQATETRVAVEIAMANLRNDTSAEAAHINRSLETALRRLLSNANNAD